MGGLYAYDIETYKNFLSYVFIEISGAGEPGEVREYVVFGDRDDRPIMNQWIREERPELVGFNNYAFDDILLTGTLLAPGKAARAVYDLGQRIIAREYSEISSYSTLKAGRDKLQTIDLMLLLGNKYNSLKEIEAKLGLPIMELPFPFDSEITADQAPELLEYNRHDVKATIALYRELLPVIETRREIGNQFGIHALSSTDSALANDILNTLYRRPEGSQGTPREEVRLGDILSSKVTFEDRELSEMLEELRELTLTAENGFRFSKAIAFGGNTYRLGIGGLHSEDSPGIFEAGETLLRDGDVSSYYPQIMLTLGVYPEHLGSGFLGFYRGMVTKRLEAKARGDRVTSDALKIAINSVFGKLSYEYFWLYDPKAFLTVTLNGQLFLLDLIEKLTHAGIRVLSANTDGILSSIPPELEATYSAVCNQWEERTGFSLEFSDYSRYIRRDVNNYLALSPAGKTKAKGTFVERKPLGDSYRAPIIARAVRNYFLEGTPLEETFSAEPSIMPFCYVFKPGGKFQMAYETPGGETIPAPRVNRYYVAQAGGTLVKLSKDRRDRVRTNPMILLNGELPEGIPGDLDLGFYVSEARKVIDKIEQPEPAQMGLFGSLGTADLERLRERGGAPESPGDSPRGIFESSYTFLEIVDGMKALSEGDSFRAPCPLHEGKDSRSLKLTEREGGIDLYCFAGCEPGEVLREIERRLDSGDTFRKPKEEPLGELVTTYDYRDEFGRISFRKHRYEPKTFRIDAWDPDSGEFLAGINGHRPLLYRLPEVIGSERVIIVEGEKDADNGRELGLEGYAFTTNFDGAGKWLPSYSQTLAYKEIVIIPDNDPPGREHGRAVANSIAPFAKSVRVLELPEGKDLSDWLALGNSAENLLSLIEETEPLKPGELFEERDLLEFPVGDPGNARAVLRLYGDRIAFSDGFGPMFYDKGHWSMGGEAKAEINQRIEDTLWRRREAALKTRDTKYEAIVKSAYPSMSRINSTRTMLENYSHVPESRFGNPPGLLNVKNGVIDMRTGALYPPHPEYGFTYRLDFDYKPGEYSAVWEEFLEETIPNPEEAAYLQEIMGYIFSGETREELVIYISGPTRSGKGTFSETLQYLGGPLAKEINIRSLIDSRSGSDQNFDLAGLYHARFVHASESKDTDWLDSAKIKALSGGNWLRAAFKGRDLFEFRPQFTVVISSNEAPKMKAEDSAAWYRLRAIEFPISKAGAENKKLKATLKEPAHMEAILSWVIEGAVRWYSRPNGLVTPKSIQERTDSFREALDYVMEFLGDHYEIAGPDAMGNWEELKTAEFYAPLDSVYSEYKSWHDTNGAPELTKINFSRKVRGRLGGANAYPNLCRVEIKDSLTGEAKLTRVIAGIRPKVRTSGGPEEPGFYDSNPY
jgi:putative DNA primase/helicase